MENNAGITRIGWGRPRSGISSSTVGMIAELRLRANLLELGHVTAAPDSDDHGVDLIVNYRTTVQVKSTTLSLNGYQHVWNLVKGRERDRPWLPADVYVLHGQPDKWWIVPAEELRKMLPLSCVTLSLNPNPGGRGRPSRFAHLHKYRDAWEVFDR